jgi:hypothetical protein
MQSLKRVCHNIQDRIPHWTLLAGYWFNHPADTRRWIRWLVRLCRSRAPMCRYICSPTRHTVWSQWAILFSTEVCSTSLGPHRSITRSAPHKLYSQTPVCGNTRSTRYIQLTQSCRKNWDHFLLQHCNSWTHRVVRVLPHTKVREHSLHKTLPIMDRWGPKHLDQTQVLNKTTHQDHTIHPAGPQIHLHINTKDPQSQTNQRIHRRTSTRQLKQQPTNNIQ